MSIGSELWSKDRNAPQKPVWRAQIVRLSAEGLGTNAIMGETGKSKTCVWRWQERFAAEGVDGLLHDKTRPSRIAKLDPSLAERVVALTMEAPASEETHWTGATMAKATRVSISSVQRIWRAHGLQPHRLRQFKLSDDPRFIDKLRDVVGLYVDPPAHAIVLSVDEKSQIQALDCTQPGLPLKKGRAGTMTHHYEQHGTTTLFAAMNVLDGTVIGRNRQRHRHQDFIRFLNAVEREVPAGKTVHAIRAIVNEALAGLAGDFRFCIRRSVAPRFLRRNGCGRCCCRPLFDLLGAAADGPAGGEGMSAPMNCQLISRWRIVEADIS